MVLFAHKRDLNVANADDGIGALVWGLERRIDDTDLTQVELDVYDFIEVAASSDQVTAITNVIGAGTLTRWLKADGDEIWGLLDSGSVEEYSFDGTSWIAGATVAASSLSQAWSVQSGLLYQDIPLVDKSVDELIGQGAASVGDAIQDVLDTARNASENIYGMVDYINSELRTVFDLADDIDLLTVEYADSILDFDFSIDTLYQSSLALALDVDDLGLDQWGLDGLDDLLEINAEGTIDLLASASLDLGFGFDLS